MEESWDVAKKIEIFENTARLTRIEKLEKCKVERVEGDERAFERIAELVGVHLDETDEGVDAGGEKTVPDETGRGEKQDGCFESRDGLSAKGCSCGMSGG